MLGLVTILSGRLKIYLKCSVFNIIPAADILILTF